MRKQTLFGIIIVIIGLNVLFQAMHFSSGSFVAPLVFFVLGVFFYKRKHPFVSMIFVLISASIFFDLILGMNFFGLLIAAIALYYGIRLVRQSNEKDEESAGKRQRWKITKKKRNREQSEQVEKENLVQIGRKANESFEHDRFERMYPTIRRSWIGDIHYTGEAFVLNDLTIWNGIGDVRLDLSKAIIPEGETVIVVQGIIGHIDFYVPDDLALSIQATSMIGETTLFHEKYGGLNKHLSIATKGYKTSPRRVKLVLSTYIGEVKVKEV
ncbi:hypothetical protein GN156_12195 [bacterium LRH843]|nr:hypothetical protein [bacterium LRH843]